MHRARTADVPQNGVSEGTEPCFQEFAEWHGTRSSGAVASVAPARERVRRNASPAGCTKGEVWKAISLANQGRSHEFTSTSADRRLHRRLLGCAARRRGRL